MTDLIEIVGAYLLGFVVTAVLWSRSRRIFEGYVFQRHNYRDHSLPTAVGILLPLAAAQLEQVLAQTIVELDMA